MAVTPSARLILMGRLILFREKPLIQCVNVFLYMGGGDIRVYVLREDGYVARVGEYVYVWVCWNV